MNAHGLVVIHDFLSVEEERDLVARARVALSSLAGVERDGGSFRSRLLRLGYDQQGAAIDDGSIPDWIEHLADRVVARTTLTQRFDSAVICEYPPGHGISAHVDSPVYVGAVAVASLGEACRLTLRPLRGRLTLSLHEAPPPESTVSIPRRALYLLSGPARDRSTHEISTDPLGSTRWSVVLRTAKARRKIW